MEMARDSFACVMSAPTTGERGRCSHSSKTYMAGLKGNGQQATNESIAVNNLTKTSDDLQILVVGACELHASLLLTCTHSLF